MSETTEGAAPAPAEEYRPTNVLSSEPEDAPEPAATEAAGETPAEPAEPAEPAAKPEKSPEDKARDRDNRRYAQQTAARYAEKARADNAERALEQMRQEIAALRSPGQQPAAPAEDFEKRVNERVAETVARQEMDRKAATWRESGVREMGAQEFGEACETLAQVSTNEQARAVMEIMLDMDDGHRVVPLLAADPEEAQRIMALPPGRMALALSKLASQAAPVAVAAPAVRATRMPEPIRPMSAARAQGEPDPNGSMEDYFRYSAKHLPRR